MKKSVYRAGILLRLLSACALCGCAKDTNVRSPTSEDLPVSRVVMYQSGIGYIERNGVVEGDELVLHIRPDQINDILKSLTVIDRANGRPVSISLPVDHTTLDALSQIPHQVRDGGIRSLLEAFRGANVEIKTKKKTFAGRIVGVETQLKQVLIDETVPDTSTVTVLTKGNVLEVIAINDIRSVSLHDPSLAEGLDKSLNISLNEGDWKLIELRIRMDKANSRELALSYLVAMPTWKPAYRLVLGDEDNGTLQGWAIVSNVTGADWKGIDFSLVSGRPMSFTYDLYRPQFLSRPDLTSLSEQRAEAPVVTQSSYAKRDARVTGEAKESAIMMNRAALAAPKAAGGGARSKMNKAAAADKLTYDEGMTIYGFDEDTVAEAEEAEEAGIDVPRATITSDEMIESFEQQASQTQIGSFDEYRLASKLTIHDGNTALVNLIQSNLIARETRMFKPVTNMNGFDQFYKGWRQNESYQTIELNNKSGVALDAGPITIYRDSAVIGEGYLARTEKDATAYITFAKEGRLDVQVTDSIDTKSVRLATVQDGNCTYDSEDKTTKTFTFTSHIPTSVTALLQIPKFDTWKPVDFPESVATNDSAYVITSNIPENGKQTVTLTMVRTRSYSRSLEPQRSDLCYQAIKSAYEANAFDDIQKPLFEQYLEDAKQYETNAARIRVLQDRQRDIEKDQSSLTRNLSGLSRIKSANAEKLRNQILSRQQQNEKKLVEITSELYEIQVANGDMQLRMQEYMKSLNYMRK